MPKENEIEALCCLICGYEYDGEATKPCPMCIARARIECANHVESAALEEVAQLQEQLRHVTHQRDRYNQELAVVKTMLEKANARKQ